MSDKTAVKKTTTTNTNNTKTQNGGEKKTYNNNNNKLNNNNNNNNKDNKQIDNKNINQENKFPPDPIYDSHQKKINDFREEIKTINASLEKIKSDMGALKSSHSGYKESIEKIYETNKSRTVDPMKSQAIEARNLLKSMIVQQEEKKKALIALEEQLPIKINKASTLENTLISIESKARELEEQIENELNANQQRALLKKASQINANKRAVAEYFTSKQQYEEIRESINKQKVQVTEYSNAVKPEEPKEKTDNLLKDLKSKRSDTEAEMKKNNENFVALKSKIDDIKKQIDDEKVLQDAHVVKRKEQRKQEAEQRKQEAEQRKLEYLEKKKADEEKRIAADLLKVPYEKEMGHCDSLVSYLLAITPKEAKDEQNATNRNIAEIEDGFVLVKKEKVSKNRENPKKKVAPVAKTQPENIRHPLEIFSDFEKLSMVPPTKYSDIPEYLEQIKQKKEHFNKLSTTEMAERLAKSKADKEAKELADKEVVTTTESVAVVADKKEDEVVATTTAADDVAADKKESETSTDSTPAVVTPQIESENTTNNTESNNVEVEAQ